MKLALNLADRGARIPQLLPLVREAESLGFHSVWLGEAYGSDAVSALGYLAARTERILLGSAIMQMHARTPAMTAMTAMTLDHLSDGRFLLGLGVSGPVVVEGWHGVPYGSPLRITREYVSLVREMIARESAVAHAGAAYHVPFQGEGSTGLGKPLRSSLHPHRPQVPVFIAAMGPKSVRQTGAIADGWLPFLYAPGHEDIVCADLDAGLAAAGRDASSVQIVAAPEIAIGADLDECRDRVRPGLALYIGGMGARGRNFYNDLVTRYGYGDVATRVQEAYLAGRPGDAAVAVTNELIDEVALVGPIERVLDRLEVWMQSRVDVLALRTSDRDILAPIRAAVGQSDRAEQPAT